MGDVKGGAGAGCGVLSSLQSVDIAFPYQQCADLMTTDGWQRQQYRQQQQQHGQRTTDSQLTFNCH